MKTLIVVSLSIATAQITWSQCQLPTGNFLFSLDLNGDGTAEADYRRVGGNSGDVVDIGYSLRSLNQTLLLQPNLVAIEFPVGVPINAQSHIVTNDAGANRILLTYYIAQEVLPGIYQCTYQDSPQILNQFADTLVGLRLNLDDGPHYGWIRFTRPDMEPSTPFAVAGYNYHPLPNEPIGAGQPPTPPPVNMTYDEAAGTLSLNWDARFPGVALEYTESLTEPVEWQPVPDASVPPVLLPVPETDRFYRLRTQ